MRNKRIDSNVTSLYDTNVYWETSISFPNINVNTLSEFEKKKGALRNEDMKKTSPFSLDDDEKVRPVIMLDDIETLGIDEDGNFCRADLKTYCDGLLQQIYSDIYPISNE